MKILQLIIITVILLTGISFPAAAVDTPTPAPASPAPEMTDIHDIKPPVEVAAAGMWRYYAAAVALLVILLSAAVWYWHKNRKTGKEKPAERPSLPEETARRMLDRLSDFRQMEGREFYFQLSIVLRRYIEERFHVGAPEMTTEEFLPRIERLQLDQDLGRQLKTLLRGADPIKYAGASAMADRMASDLDFAHDFVNQTTRAAYVAEEKEKVGA